MKTFENSRKKLPVRKKKLELFLTFQNKKANAFLQKQNKSKI